MVLRTEKTVNDVCKIGYIPGVTKCTCDDKKTPCQSMQKLAKRKGLAIVVFRNRAGYVKDGIVPVQSGFYLCGRYIYVDETERDSYLQLYRNLPERDGSLVLGDCSKHRMGEFYHKRLETEILF